MITRRSVLKSIAASAIASAVPIIRLRQSVPDERLLMAFCDPEAFRYDFKSPFGLGSLTYATDSRALIRCELTGRDEIGERRLPKDVLRVWSDHWNPVTQWRPLTPDDLVPTVSPKNYDVCPDCGNRRISLGDRFPQSIEEQASLPHYDPDDNTIRDASCQTCKGIECSVPTCCEVEGVIHSAYTLKRILALPNPQICVSLSPETHRHSFREHLLFRADGFEGISLGVDPK